MGIRREPLDQCFCAMVLTKAKPMPKRMRTARATSLEHRANQRSGRPCSRQGNRRDYRTRHARRCRRRRHRCRADSAGPAWPGSGPGVLPLWKRNDVVSCIGVAFIDRFAGRLPCAVWSCRTRLHHGSGQLRDLTNAAYDAASRTAARDRRNRRRRGYVADDLQLGEDLLDDPNKHPLFAL